MTVVTIDDMLVEALLKDEGYIILTEFFSCTQKTHDAVAADFLESGLTIDEYFKTSRSTDIIVKTAPNLD